MVGMIQEGDGSRKREGKNPIAYTKETYSPTSARKKKDSPWIFLCCFWISKVKADLLFPQHAWNFQAVGWATAVAESTYGALTGQLFGVQQRRPGSRRGWRMGGVIIMSLLKIYAYSWLCKVKADFWLASLPWERGGDSETSVGSGLRCSPCTNVTPQRPNPFQLQLAKDQSGATPWCRTRLNKCTHHLLKAYRNISWAMRSEFDDFLLEQ